MSIESQLSSIARRLKVIEGLLTGQQDEKITWIRAGKFAKATGMTPDEVRGYREDYKGNVELLRDRGTGHYDYNLTAYQQGKHMLAIKNMRVHRKLNAA